jgi:hypothetical protein
VKTLLDLQNDMNIWNWRWLWHLRGGSFHVTARDSADLRTPDLQERGRRLEVNMSEVRRQEEQPVKQPVNLAKRRIARARKRA